MDTFKAIGKILHPQRSGPDGPLTDAPRQVTPTKDTDPLPSSPAAVSPNPAKPEDGYLKIQNAPLNPKAQDFDALISKMYSLEKLLVQYGKKGPDGKGWTLELYSGEQIFLEQFYSVNPPGWSLDVATPGVSCAISVRRVKDLRPNAR